MLDAAYTGAAHLQVSKIAAGIAKLPELLKRPQ
jgi:predicted ribosome quality control (RQC) complex YloA/Tae2 family protein